MDAHKLRETISSAYAKAVTDAGQGRSCCGGASCCAQVAGSGDLAEMAGYGEERFKHSSAAASSFGCGNPLAFSGVTPGQTVLDLGSGAGLDLLLASDKVGPGGLVIGVDMTEAMLHAARENSKRAGRTNIEVRQGIIEALPVEDDSVDWVISNCVINLSPEKEKVFREIHRVLNPGGRISISDVVCRELPDWLRQSIPAHIACVAGAIDEEAYLEGLRQAGIAEVEVVERLVYSADQLRAVFGDSLREASRSGEDEAVFRELEGKIWSAKFVGRKPL